jgi:DNA invertase Pin-like site-specific DNA recombinase
MGVPETVGNWAAARRLAEGDSGKAILRGAFVGRTSNKDQQDPTLSLPRQLAKAQGALPDHAVLVAHFYDVESGRIDLAARSRGVAHELFTIPIPRDGGINDLLDEAERPDRRFDFVICESIDRLARTTYSGTLIEHRLQQAGVPLLAADEPINLDRTGRRRSTATMVLTRRVKQGIAEWYVLEMLEKSWDGFATHTEQGYNVGKPPYGYRALAIAHPVPAKRAKGVKKTRLIVDATEGTVVRKIYSMRVVERMGYQAIADDLNRDLTAHPPPTPVEPGRAVGRWTSSNVREILTNPKHTGHMVWNRRARKGAIVNRVNPIEEWIWSLTPVHEALISLETFVQAQDIGAKRERSRTASGLNKHPQATQVYRLRGYLFCDLCNRRMNGKTKRGIHYYVCAPRRGYLHGDHPAPGNIWIREDYLLAGVEQFFAERVFGPYRTDLLASDAERLFADQVRSRANNIAGLRGQIADLHQRRRQLARNFELIKDPDQAWLRDIHERRAELRSQITNLENQLAALEDHEEEIANRDPLDLLPIRPLDLGDLPDELSRRLFASLRLEVRYNRDTDTATCRIGLVSTSSAFRVA